MASNLATVGVIVWGCYRIFESGPTSDIHMTTGALIAASMLTSRAMAPLGQIAGLIIRFHQSWTSLKGLNRLMALPVERPRGKVFMRRPRIEGAIEFRNVHLQVSERADRGAGRRVVQDPARRAGRHPRPHRLRQDHDRAPDPRPLRAERGRRAGRRHRHPPARPDRPAPEHRLRAAGPASVLRLGQGQHHAGRALCRRGVGDPRRDPGRRRSVRAPASARATTCRSARTAACSPAASARRWRWRARCC